MRWMVMVAALVASTAAVAQERQQFDLMCKGKGAEKHYRIDLQRGEWCADQCPVVATIAEVTSGTLLLKNEKLSQNGNMIIERVNRSTGVWFYAREFPASKWGKVVSGSCEIAPFSGFPAAKF